MSRNRHGWVGALLRRIDALESRLEQARPSAPPVVNRAWALVCPRCGSFELAEPKCGESRPVCAAGCGRVLMHPTDAVKHLQKDIESLRMEQHNADSRAEAALDRMSSAELRTARAIKDLEAEQHAHAAATAAKTAALNRNAALRVAIEKCLEVVATELRRPVPRIPPLVVAGGRR